MKALDGILFDVFNEKQTMLRVGYDVLRRLPRSFHFTEVHLTIRWTSKARKSSDLNTKRNEMAPLRHVANAQCIGSAPSVWALS
jgi:hypothetical protein